MGAEKRQRVVFVGIDGAAWEVIEPMVAAGRLPNLAAMMEAGVRGTLKSTLPPNSSLAWASFLTGCHPGKHGVFFFREKRPGSYQRPVISFHSIQAPTIWKLAGDAGRTVVSIAFPLSYPVEKVNGALIGGLLTPDRDSDFIHPPGLRAELERELGPVPSDNEPEKIFHAGGEQAALDCLLQVTEQITRIGEYLLKTRDPDLFTLVFRGVDLASHQAWRFRDPAWAGAHPRQARGREGIVELLYERVDAALGRLRDAALALDGQVAFGCCSDHGFGPITYRFFVNRWLVEKGWLVLKPGAARARLGLFVQRKWNGLLRRTGLGRRRLRKAAAGVPGPEASFLDMVDWSRTRAWSSFSGGEDIVLINRKGREPQGIVEPGAEYEALRDEILAGLLAIRAPDGAPVVAQAFRREDLWEGPQLAWAPDIQFLTRDTSVNAAADPLHARIVEPALEGIPAMHRVDGVYLWEGEGIFPRGVRRDGPQIADMGPTLLHLLGLPVDEHMDGRVMEACYTPSFRAAHPVRSRRDHVHLAPRTLETTRSAEDEAKLVETMQALGYFE